MTSGQGIKALCGGRAAILPADVAEAEDLSDGAYRLFATLCGRADRRDQAELVVKAYADKRKVKARSVQRWKAEIEAAGLVVQLHEGDKSRGRYRIVRRPEERRAAALKNVKTLAERKQAKTTELAKEKQRANAAKNAQPPIPATLMSHPRCDMSVAHTNTGKITPTLPLTPSLEAEPEGEKPKAARQRKGAGGKRAAQGHLILPIDGGKQKPTAPDWNSHAERLRRTHIGDNPIGWCVEQSVRIGQALQLPGPQADQMLDTALRTSYRTGEDPARAVDRALKQRGAA